MKDEPVQQPVLTYDAHSAKRDPRAPWTIPGFCLGMVTSGALYSCLGLILIQRDSPGVPIVTKLIEGGIVPLAFSIVALLPAVIALGLTIWLKQTIFKEVRYARFRAAFLWGLSMGLYPWSVFRFNETSDEWRTILLLGVLAWSVVWPAVAGCFLCYRSHLRD